MTIAALIEWITHYGVIALYGLLALGIIGLPIPDETLLLMAGVLIGQGSMHFFPTYLFAFLGAVTGITVSYLIGRFLEKTLVHRLLKYFHGRETSWQTIESWNASYGKWSLTIGYFIPGIRHITGIFAGVMKLNYRLFALFAYIGAFLWTVFFLTLGYLLGDKWIRAVNSLYERYGMSILLIALCVFIAFLSFSWRYFKKTQEKNA